MGNLKRTVAIDSVSVRSVDDNGFLHVQKSPLTRVQVAPYYGQEIAGWRELGLDPEKIYHAYRPPEELSSPETIQSINGIPIHLEHHDDHGAPENRKTRVGTTGTDGAFEAPFLVNSLHIYDKDARSRIEDGSMRELSLAYTFEPDFTPGETPDGEKYDYVQRKIRANHLALVETGRAGPEVRVRDSNKDFLNMEKDDAVEQAEVTLAKAIIDLHSVDPNGKIVDGAQDDDKDAMIQKIIEGLKAKGLTDEEAEKLKNTLSDLAYSQATGDEDPKPDEQKEAQDDDPELDEKMKDPNFKAGFEAGVLYGEKREKDDPKRIDSDHEREGEERYLEKEAEDALKSCGLDEASEEEKKAFAAGLNYAQKKDEGAQDEDPKPDDGKEEKSSASDSMKILRNAIYSELAAIEEVKPVLGVIRAGSYDSAGSIYVAALKKLGLKNIPASEARSAYRAYMQGRKALAGAKDSGAKVTEKPTAVSAILNNVK